MAGKKTARKNNPGTVEDVRTWWEKLGLKRHRVMRPSGRTVMVWMDGKGNEFNG